MKKRIIIVSNRLPVSVGTQKGKITLQRSNGGVATALSSIMESDEYDALWAGWTGSKVHISQRALARAGWDKRLLPVHFKRDILQRYYERMSNGVLWPLLHGLPAAIQYEPADWRAYVKANRAFAVKLRRVLKPNDTIWIHDYQLMLLPQLLREAGAMNRIGFFLHTPFARANCLMQLPEYIQIARSLSQVDVLGFQTDGDAASFQASLVELGVSMRPGSITGSFPIGVDFDMYQQSIDKRSVQQAMASIAKQIRGKRTILSVSRLDYTKGIVEQLHAFERFLERAPDPTRYMYKLIVAPSREDVAGYKELKQQIEQEVARINTRFDTQGDMPIVYSYQSHGFDELSAWYQLSDVLLTTPIIDGMNLVIKEYIASRHDERGAVVMSNTIGAARQLHTALQVDPQDIAGIASALQHAFGMSDAERAERWRAMSSVIQYQDVFWWLHGFLAALESRTQMLLVSQQVHTSRMRLSGRLESLRLLRLARNR
jgi:trehalose 6-phosphate synthase/phosphatase